jgi:hypothetical protein
MKQLICSMALILLTSNVVAETRSEQRQENQDQRIENGQAEGSLTKREAFRLDHQQKRIERRQTRMEADGNFTKAEKVRLNRQQRAASQNIARKKNNARNPR